MRTRDARTCRAKRIRPPEAGHGAGDAGVSLVELLVTMGIMSVVGVLFTGAILQIHRVTNAVEAMSRAQAQVRLALQRLDGEIRYAYGISAPTTAAEAANSGAWYVEFLRVDATTGEECRQLQLKDGRLRLRRWSPGTPPSAGNAGAVLASEIDMSAYAMASSSGDPVPFELQASGSETTAPTPVAGSGFSPDFQRLRVRLAAEVGGKPLAADTTFVALNSPRTAGSTSAVSKAEVCRQEGR